MVDYNKKREDIISDYYSTIGKFNNVSMLISQKDYEINENDDAEKKKEKEGQQREILIDLGRVAEMAFKYIIKIKRMELYPNEPYLNITSNGQTIKGFQEKEKLTAGVVREIGNSQHASISDIEDALNVSGIGPKAHDFNYLYTIIDKLFPDVRDTLNEFMGIKMKSDNISKVFEVEEFEYPIFTVFPNEELKTEKDQNADLEKVRKLIEKRNLVISNAGDIFSRLRYYANNPFDKNYDIDEIYEVVNNLISFIKTVHLYNEKLDINPEIAFSHYKLREKNLSKFTKEEITKIYSHGKLKSNCSAIVDCIFYSHNMSFDQIMEIVNCDDIPVEYYTLIFTNELTLETILYFRSIGINDYEEMASELTRGLLGRYSLEEYKNMRETLNASENPNILVLADHLSVDSIKKLTSYPELLKFFIYEFYPNVNLVSYNYKDTLFTKLLSIEEVRENPNSWFGLDIDQLKIYWDISNLLLKDPMLDEIVNKGNYYADMIINNIKDNIRTFKNNPKMLCVMPLMLDCEDNKSILDILIKNGLDVNNLRGFDSTIFCFPVKLVEVIENILYYNDIPLIIDNKVNPIVNDVITAISYNLKGEIKLKNRRIPFFKSSLDKNYNFTNNPIIDELTYEEELNLDFSDETKKQLEQFGEKIKNMTEEDLVTYLMRLNSQAKSTLK